MDFSLVNCTYRKVKNPKAMLTSEWIRPEDVHYYEELAEETGISINSLKNYECARRVPDGYNLHLLSDFFRVDEEYILGSSDC